MKKLLHLKAIQVLKGNAAVTEEILKALRKSNGNMRKACELLGVGKSSMYRIIDEIGAKQAVDDLIASKGYRLRGKVRAVQADDVEEEVVATPAACTRVRTRKAAS